jgi:hypothetical protein
MYAPRPGIFLRLPPALRSSPQATCSRRERNPTIAPRLLPVRRALGVSRSVHAANASGSCRNRSGSASSLFSRLISSISTSIRSISRSSSHWVRLGARSGGRADLALVRRELSRGGCLATVAGAAPRWQHVAVAARVFLQAPGALEGDDAGQQAIEKLPLVTDQKQGAGKLAEKSASSSTRTSGSTSRTRARSTRRASPPEKLSERRSGSILEAVEQRRAAMPGGPAALDLLSPAQRRLGGSSDICASLARTRCSRSPPSSSIGSAKPLSGWICRCRCGRPGRCDRHR